MKKESFQNPDPFSERSGVEKNILKHMGQLSSDNYYQELLKFCIENNLFCFEYHYQHKKRK